MGRPKNFSRESVLEKALPVFWKSGFAHTSLQDLESLRHYIRKRREDKTLTAKPLGWRNIERFLKFGPSQVEGRKGCFSVNSMNQFALLPSTARDLVLKSRDFHRDLVLKNVEAEKPRMKPTLIADMIFTFFIGIAMEQHLKGGKASNNRKIDDFLKVVRKL
jgi:TetR/AcrR family transcriptional regulator, copper-responsive repressor